MSEENVNKKLWNEFQKEIDELKPSSTSSSADILENVKKNIKSMVWDWDALRFETESPDTGTMESQTLRQYEGKWFIKKLENLRRQLNIKNISLPSPHRKNKETKVKAKCTEVKVKSSYECQVCFKHLASRPGLSRHMLIHRQIKAHHCETCGKKFGQRGNLVRHQDSHQDKRHQCAICGLLYKSSDSLRKHQKKKHPDSIQKK